MSTTNRSEAPALAARWPLTQSAVPRGEALLRALYAGQLFVFRATDATRGLVALCREALAGEVKEASGAGDAWRCPVLSFEQLSRVRERLYAHPALRPVAAEVIASLDVPTHTRVDTPRLRMVAAGAETQPEAAPVYVVHRDTWYACPQAQINWWVPVFDTPASQAFAFYPRFFEVPVDNGSQGFEYGRWMREVGWHGAAPLGDYPAPHDAEAAFGPAHRFSFAAGDLLLFSASHLHQTLPNPIAGTSRLSVDFRTVTGLPEGAEAPNVDNGSSGADARVREEMREVATLLG